MEILSEFVATIVQNTEIRTPHYMQLISGVFEHSMLRIGEMYALENNVFYTVLYGPHKPIIIRVHRRESALGHDL